MRLAIGLGREGSKMGSVVLAQQFDAGDTVCDHVAVLAVASEVCLVKLDHLRLQIVELGQFDVINLVSWDFVDKLHGLKMHLPNTSQVCM